jgi:hypothetical protein
MEETMARTRNKAAVCGSALALLIWAAVPAWAAVKWVENFGVDSGACGASFTTPCRTIDQAITNASPLDVILVGPGVYGDIDGDGSFTTPGDEAAEIGSGCNCVVKVNKRLTILSRRGTAATVIRYSVQNDASIVDISASRSVFRGFTLYGGSRSSSFSPTSLGLQIEPNSDYVVAVSNRGLNAGTVAFSVQGSTDVLVANQALDSTAGAFAGFDVDIGAKSVLSSNLAVGYRDFGFFVAGVASGTVLAANQAQGNGEGFDDTGSNSILAANMASANATYGFFLEGLNGLARGNIASANGLFGFGIAPQNKLLASSAIGNQQGGVLAENVGGTISANNIFGNGIVANDNGDLNCGIENVSGGTVTATYNFWGTSVGPGTAMSPAPEPADNACDYLGSNTITAPFATVRFP